MRLDEHGRWVSDDGAYVWDETAQTWQLAGAPSSSAASGSGPDYPAGGGQGGPRPQPGQVWPAGSHPAGPGAGEHESTGPVFTGQSYAPPGAGPARPAGGTRAPGATGPSSVMVPAATTATATSGPATAPTAAAAERTGSFELAAYAGDDATGSWELPGEDGADASPDAVATGEFSRPGPAATGPMPVRVAGPAATAGTPVRTAGQTRNPAVSSRRGPDAGTGAFPVPVGAGDTGAPADITDGIPRRTAQSWQPRPATRFTPVGTDADDDIDDDADDRRRDTRGPGRGGLGAALRRPPVLAGLTALVLLLALGVAGFVVLGGDEAEPTASAPDVTEGRYEASIRQNYIDACLGVSDGNERYCTCTLEKLEAGYTQEQYLAFNSDVESDNSQRIVREIYAACRNLR